MEAPTLAQDAEGDAAATLWLRLSQLPPPAAAGRAGATLRGARLEVNAPLAELLEGQGELVAARLAESPSLPAFLVELRSLLDAARLQRAEAAAAAAAARRPAAFFGLLHAELGAVGWGRVAYLAPDLSTLSLAVPDAAGRRHELRLSLPPGYPAAPPAAATDLPLPFELRWGGGGGGGSGGAAARTLPELVAQFEAALAQHQELWDDLDDLDEQAWVVEPPLPAPRAAAFRRIALGGHATLGLALDPRRPSAPPAASFMGPDAAVAPLRAALHAALAGGRWREGVGLRANLEAALGRALPRRGGGEGGGGGGGEEEDVSADCAICYAYRLPPPEGAAEGAEGEAPDVSCDNPRCSKPFHRGCLVEWLNADTSTRQSFGTLFGACPYCSEPITVRVA